MQATWDILGLGVAAVDDLVYVDHYPEPDVKMPARAMQRQGGGLTATALVAASRLGARTAYCAVLGDNELSRYTRQELEREGVDCSPVIARAGAQPYHSVIIVDQSTGQRTILYSAEGVVWPEANQVGPGLIERCRVLFLDWHAGPAGLRALALAQELGIPTVADIEGTWEPGAPEMIERVDHLIVGVRVAQSVTGAADPAEMVRGLSRPARACAVVTAGERGCWYSERGGPVRYRPAYPVQAVDTTGCGDVFHGAYAAALAAGQSIAGAIEMAAAAAAIKATVPGGRAGIPTPDILQRFMAGHARTRPAL